MTHTIHTDQKPSDLLLWNFEYDGEVHDIEACTKKEAEKIADNWWFDEHCDDTVSVEEEGELIQYFYDDEGEVVETHREKFWLSYEYYHGDYAEHNVNHNLI